MDDHHQRTVGEDQGSELNGVVPLRIDELRKHGQKEEDGLWIRELQGQAFDEPLAETQLSC